MPRRIKRYSTIAAPQLPASASMTLLERADCAPAYAQTQLEAADWSGGTLSNAELEQCVIKASRFNDLRAQHWSWEDVQIQRCELLNTDIEHARWRRCEVFDSRLGGIRLNEAQLDNVLIRGCQIDFGVLWNARLEHVRFDDCRMTDMSLAGARLKHVTLRNCDLSRADFSGAFVEELDLRGCMIEGMVIEASALRGAMIDPQQALALMPLLGITVKSLDEDDDNG